MTQTRRQVWVEVFAVFVTLALGGVLLYTLLPSITTPGQLVVPPPQSMDTSQMMLTLFVAGTAGVAPVMIGWVLMQIFKFASKRVPASSAAAPELPTPQVKPRPAEQPKEMSPREALIWKIVATVLLLIVGSGALALLASAFERFYRG